MLCFVLINSVLFNLLRIWILFLNANTVTVILVSDFLFLFVCSFPCEIVLGFRAEILNITLVGWRGLRLVSSYVTLDHCRLHCIGGSGMSIIPATSANQSNRYV